MVRYQNQGVFWLFITGAFVVTPEAKEHTYFECHRVIFTGWCIDTRLVVW